ncbi:PDZ domain-containing protein [Phycisphaeraceae bacterium D3-23]
MKRKSLTTAALLTAAMALPTLAEDAQAQTVQVEHDVVVVRNGGGEAGEAHTLTFVDASEIEGAPSNGVVLNVEVVGEPGIDGADREAVRARVMMIDENGNVIELEGDEALLWVEGDDMVIPGVEIVPMPDKDIQVFLREIGRPDVVGQAPANAPMVEATYLGISCEPLDFDAAALLLVDEGTGLAVTFVAEDSPASAAGLEVGDTLLQLDNQVLINPEQLAVLIRTHDAGEGVTLLVVRDGEEFELEAELGTNTVPQLGPGGRNLNQFWNVERQGNAGEFRVLPEGLHGRLAQINPEIANIEEHMALIEAMLAEQMQAMPDLAEIRGNAEQMREQMHIHEEALRQMIEQMHGAEGQFEFDEQHEMEFKNNAAMNIVWNDGEHTIKISGDGEGNQTLNVTDADGNELYDGEMPEGDALDELPEGVGDKVREMQDMNHFEFRFEGAPEAPAAPVAPAAPEAPAQPEADPAADA